MDIFSWEYEFKGAARTWVVSCAFIVVALFCGILLPYLITPHPTAQSLQVPGKVIRLEVDDAMEKPIFQFLDQNSSTHEFASSFSSNHSAYQTGDTVTISFDSTSPTNAFVQNDKDLAMVMWILRALAAVFGVLGIIIIGLKLKGLDDEKISRIAGLVGALTFAIPSIFSIPIIYFLKSSLGQSEWIIGAIFTVTGLLVLIGTLALYRYQARTGKDGWDWSWEWSNKKDDTKPE